LGAFADQLADRIEIPYADIPGWPHSTAMGHAGKMVITPDVVVLSGRAHLYEGHPIQSVVFGVRVLHALGIRSIVFTNAAGGINLSYSQGALVLISDHINLQPANPLIGPNDDTLGPRCPDLTEAYSATYRDIARKAGSLMGLTLQEGVYAALSGPNYETPAEIRYLRTIGADLVGMSTVPEVILANYLGIKVLAISCVTNMAAGMAPGKINHEEVLEIGRQVRGTLVQLLNAVLPQLT
jgi:purine-nucleoside phosphorylase